MKIDMINNRATVDAADLGPLLDLGTKRCSSAYAQWRHHEPLRDGGRR